jgi:hypothetical protein
MRPMEETMAILYFEIEEIEIVKEITSVDMLNITQNNNSLYQMVQPLQDQTAPCTDIY